MNPWPAIVSFPGPSALVPVWRDYLADAFVPFSTAFLQPDPPLVSRVRCPRRCGCHHQIIPCRDGSFLALCRCDPPTCEPLPFQKQDLLPAKPSWTKLSRALSQALALDPKFLPLGPHNTWQIGAWSTDAVPVILTLRAEPCPFRAVLTELALRQQKPFILLTPTSEPFDATSNDLLHHARAAAFSLETTVSLTEHGTLVPLKPPGELFAQFRPEPKETVAEETARQVWALARTLDAGSGERKAPSFRVFLLYCRDGLDAGQIARRCRCTRGLVFIRLRWLRARLGRNLEELRQYSEQFERMEESLSDSRARRIYRPGAALGEEEAES